MECPRRVKRKLEEKFWMTLEICREVEEAKRKCIGAIHGTGEKMFLHSLGETNNFVCTEHRAARLHTALSRNHLLGRGRCFYGFARRREDAGTV